MTLLRIDEAKHTSIIADIDTETDTEVDLEAARGVIRDIITIDMLMHHTLLLARLAGNGVIVTPK